jgi:peptide-methionine (S)-S-oxide reductase
VSGRRCLQRHEVFVNSHLTGPGSVDTGEAAAESGRRAHGGNNLEISGNLPQSEASFPLLRFVLESPEVNKIPAIAKATWLAVLASLLVPLAACAAEAPVVIPAPLVGTAKAAGPTQTAVLAGGCFWGVQGVFQHLNGVRQVLSGYAGGEKQTASYEAVSRGDTGHAESVEVVFDPAKVSYGEILQVYFSVAHDPTQLNRQGPDTGTQYRSAIFYTTEEQKNVAQAYIAQLDKAGVFPRKIVTRVDPLKGFYAAEKYHQDFLLDNPGYPYIVYNDLPKVRNFAKLLPTLYQKQALATNGKLR